MTLLCFEKTCFETLLDQIYHVGSTRAEVDSVPCNFVADRIQLYFCLFADWANFLCSFPSVSFHYRTRSSKIVNFTIHIVMTQSILAEVQMSYFHFSIKSEILHCMLVAHLFCGDQSQFYDCFHEDSAASFLDKFTNNCAKASNGKTLNPSTIS